MKRYEFDPLASLVDELAVDRRDSASLLTRLAISIRSSLGKTHSGHSAAFERSPMNLDAFELWRSVDALCANMYLAATEDTRRHREPSSNLLGWWREFEADRSRGQITMRQEIVATARLASVAYRVRSLLDPPVMKELLAACPHCGERFALGETLNAALWISYRPGEVLRAGCRCCSTRWVGEAQLIALAKAIDVTIDVDAVRDARARTQ